MNVSFKIERMRENGEWKCGGDSDDDDDARYNSRKSSKNQIENRTTI